MRGYSFINNVLGWTVGLVAFLVYLFTLEESVSLWDCGEFISASYKLMVVHPPGAPFFLMLGRLFSMMASEPTQVAFWVNTMSGLASAMAVMFTFWIITYFAKKLVSSSEGSLTFADQLLIFASGVTGALSMTFMDSFWFSAVEAEVYALSSFFTMVTFWAALKWEQSNSRYADRWLVLIGLLIGISIGTHLLSLLVIPAVAFIYYFKKTSQVTWKGGIIAFVVGFLILTFVQNIMIPGVPWLMTKFDLIFVNTLGFGFNSGSLFAVILIIALVVAGVVWSRVKQKAHVYFAFVSLAYILLGYSTYAMVVIRSGANPPIDMNNPADPFNLLSYINREQYGDRPLLYGPHFNAQPIKGEEGKRIYTKGENEYKEIGRKQKLIYEPNMQTFLPRMGDMQKEGSPSGYRFWSGMDEIQNRIEMLEQTVRSEQDQEKAREMRIELEQLERTKPSFRNNMLFFIRYQLGHMYFRYFMWNFAGRQNDIQGHHHNRFFDGNWISGITPIDAIRLGTQANIPSEMKNNKARNTYYFLPLILGIMGMVFQYKKGKNDFIANMVFFLYTGILIIVFLNQPPYEPRERDYAVVGSFQVFCIWIGLGVLMLANLIRKLLPQKGLSAIAASVIAFVSVPVLMGAQGWDDHDRSGRRLGIDFAINYLESCAPNAILFTNGDNDTYPLWYAQNVEGIRTDIRIINMSLLPTDWYSTILLDTVYESAPLPLSLTKTDLRAGNNDYVSYMENPAIDATKFYPLDQIIQFVISPDKKARNSYGQNVNYLPTRNFRIAIDKEGVLKNQVVPAEDSSRILSEMRMTFNKGIFHKGDMVFYDLIAQNAAKGWERPIYFTTTTGRGSYYGLEKYFQLEGLTYRLVPIESRLDQGMVTRMPEDILFANLMEKFQWFNMKEKENFFMDEKSLLVPQNLQSVMVRFANDLLDKADAYEKELSILTQDIPGMPEPPPGRQLFLETTIKKNKERAAQLLDKAFDVMPERVLYFSNNPKYFAAIAYHRMGRGEDAVKHMKELYDRNLEMLTFFAQFENKIQLGNYGLMQIREAISFVSSIKQSFENWGMEEMANTIDTETAPYFSLARRQGLIR
jgi:hypothetical protein